MADLSRLAAKRQRKNHRRIGQLKLRVVGFYLCGFNAQQLLVLLNSSGNIFDVHGNMEGVVRHGRSPCAFKFITVRKRLKSETEQDRTGSLSSVSLFFHQKILINQSKKRVIYNMMTPPW